MNNPVLTAEEYQWLWMAYYMSSVALWFCLFWFFAKLRFWPVVSLIMAAFAGLLFTPWYISDGSPEFAPAAIIFLFETFAKTGDSPARLVVPMGGLALVTFFALALINLLSAAFKSKTTVRL